LFVRGCWLVSFFFTPIYMFILIFIVSFGTKKGTLAAYSFAWETAFRKNISLLFNARLRKSTISDVYPTLMYRFQHTALTSRTTIYILLSFWCFFFFFGESLLLITFNYNTLTDLIPSSFFTFIKTHVIFMTSSNNAFIGDTVLFLILFFSTAAAAFLLNLRFAHSYSYTRETAVIDLVAVLVILFFLSSKVLLIVAAFWYIGSLRASRLSAN
jgi:hypothetical protein